MNNPQTDRSVELVMTYANEYGGEVEFSFDNSGVGKEEQIDCIIFRTRGVIDCDGTCECGECPESEDGVFVELEEKTDVMDVIYVILDQLEAESGLEYFLFDISSRICWSCD